MVVHSRNGLVVWNVRAIPSRQTSYGFMPAILMPLEGDGSRVGRIVARDEVEECRLPRAVGADETEQLAAAQLEMGVVDGDQAPEGLGDVVDPEDKVVAKPFSSLHLRAACAGWPAR